MDSERWTFKFLEKVRLRFHCIELHAVALTRSRSVPCASLMNKSELAIWFGSLVAAASTFAALVVSLGFGHLRNFEVRQILRS